MGAYVSTEQCQTNYRITLNCNFTYDNKTGAYSQISDYTGNGTFPANADIAGVGILGVFIAVTSFALAASTASVLWQFAKFVNWKKVYPPEEKARRSRFSFSDILEALVLSCSDQQVFTGAAYALTLRYWNGCKISAYHYNIVANMLLLTCATHLMAVTIVRNYWQYPWLGLLRVLCITGVFIFTGLIFINQNAEGALDFPTDVPRANETSSLLFLPAACFESSDSPVGRTLKASTDTAKDFGDVMVHSNPGNRVHGWNLYLVTLFFYMAALVAEIIRFIRRGRERPGWRSKFANKISPLLHPFRKTKKLVSGIFLIYIALGIGISAASTFMAGTYIFSMRSWVYKSGWIQYENNKNPEQDATDFGQLVPIFMSSLILFSFLQIISDKMTESNDRRHENDPEKPHQGEHVPFIDPSKPTLVVVNNTDTAYHDPQVHTPGIHDAESILSGWNLNSSRKGPSYQISTMDIDSPGLGIANHSPLLYSKGSKESIPQSHASTGSASTPSPGLRSASSAGFPGTPPFSSPRGLSPTSRSFSQPRPPRPGYSPLNHQLGTGYQ